MIDAQIAAEDGNQGTPPEPTSFDFAKHRSDAVDAYLRARPDYESFALAVRDVLRQSLTQLGTKVQSVEARAKDVESFGDKAILPSEHDPNVPKYAAPLREITDLSGVRVITYFPKAVKTVDDVIRNQFDVVEHTDIGRMMLDEERLGYQSVHYLVRMKPMRTALPEYSAFGDLIAEIQVRTVLQHAWAEIEHDIDYKSPITTPKEIRRRLTTLAGLLELGDREFQSIQDEDESLRKEALESVQRGELDSVEITADALRAYLDRRLGPDDCIARSSYDFEAALLRRMRFTSFTQIEQAIAELDDDQLSRARWGNRQGQLERFRTLLLVGMGPRYIALHPWSRSPESWAAVSWGKDLERLTRSGITIGNYSPIVDEAPQGDG